MNLVDCEACFLLDVYLTYGTNGRSGWATILLSRSLQIAMNDLSAIHAGIVVLNLPHAGAVVDLCCYKTFIYSNTTFQE